MTFPNALEGVKKIYKAEIIELIVGILSVIATLLLLIGAKGAETDAAGAALGGLFGGGIIMIAVAVLHIIAFIKGIIGVRKAMPDEDDFKNAFYVIIIGIIATVVFGLAKAGTVLSNAGQLVDSVSIFLAQFYIIGAIITLAQALGDSEMEAKGAGTRKILIVVWTIRIILEMINIFVTRNTVLTTVSGVLAVSASIIGVVAYVMYLRLLKTACVMLER